MSNPANILSRCRKMGLRLWTEGDRIGIFPKRVIPPGLLAEIRAAKFDLLPLVRDKEVMRLAPDQIPWVHVARQVLQGEFEGADRCLHESLIIGLRSIPHPQALQAYDLLRANSNLP